MASDLLKSSLEGKNVKVPIGQPIVTNIPSQNSLRIQQIMTGRPLVAPDVSQLDVSSFDGKDLSAQQDRLQFTEPVVLVNDKRVVRWAFDDTSGKLVGIRVDGTQIEIVGFLRQIDFGVGPTGPRGNPGRDGVDGKDGIDGEKGVRGQPGIMGPQGAQGYQGNDGIDGPMGATGPVGLQGITGPTGPRGSEGMAGMEGKRGDKGFSCPATLRGPTGPDGKTMSPLVGLKKGPTAHELIFAAGTEDDCGCDIPCNFEEIPAAPIVVSQTTFDTVTVCPPGQTVRGIRDGETSFKVQYVKKVYSDGSETVDLVPTSGTAPYCATPKDITIVSRTVKKAPSITCPTGQTVNGVEGGTAVLNGTYEEIVYSDGTIEATPYVYEGECMIQAEPCGKDVNATGSGKKIKYHNIGTKPGLVEFEYATVGAGGNNLNSFDVYMGDTLVMTTNGFVKVQSNAKKKMSFQYDPKAPGASPIIKVVIDTQKAGAEYWYYKLFCPR